MPDGKTVFRQVRPEHGTHRRVEDRADRHSRRDANDEACQDQKLGREAHQDGGSCGVRGRSLWSAARRTRRG